MATRWVPRSPASQAPLRRVVLTWLTTASGGAERSTVELAQGLRALLGIEVVVIWWDGAGAPAPVPRGVRVRQVADHDAYERTLCAELGEDPAGTVLIGAHRTAMVDIVAAESFAVPVVSVLRGILVADQRLRTVDPRSRRLVPRLPGELDWDVLSRASRWVGVSRAATSSIRELAAKPVDAITIHNAVHLGLYRRPRNPSSPRRFAVVARTEPWKLIDRVIRAFALLPDDLAAHTRLDIYGTGSALPELRRLADGLRPGRDIRFRGEVPDHRWLAATDVLVAACDIEGFGRSVLEAGGAGIPQIVPDRGGSTELVISGVTGLAYSADDPAGLASALAEAAGWTASRLDALGCRARLNARSFSQTRCFLAYARLAREVRAGNRNLPQLPVPDRTA
ncbi:glycosyltransferase family 4 protein [Amycolatopsis speibonae]|uniref:Glycosyltransferase family 4 protein n=1 Tax=Amycolatopsis speibonae TaxID=1450224 RepID=A0ABV7PB60_9PSEU